MERFTNISYIPFVGWMFPMAVKGNSDFAMSHAKQAFVLTVLFTCGILFLYVISILVPSSLKILRTILVIMIYILYAGYFGLCGIGTYLAIKRQFIEFPVIKEFTGKLGF